MNLASKLPLTETTYYILLSLNEPAHGYLVMQHVEQMSEGTVRIAAGTMYGALENLSKQQLIKIVPGEGRRKVYQITEEGKDLVKLEHQRLCHLTQLYQTINGGK